MLFSFLRDVFVFSLISVNMSTWRAGGRGGKDDFKLPVIVDEPVVERVTVEEGCQAWRGSYCQSPTYVNYHPIFFWDFFPSKSWCHFFMKIWVAWLPSASTALSSLATTAGGGEAEDSNEEAATRFGARARFPPRWRARRANAGPGARGCCTSLSAWAQPQLDRWLVHLRTTL